MVKTPPKKVAWVFFGFKGDLRANPQIGRLNPSQRTEKHSQIISYFYLFFV